MIPSQGRYLVNIEANADHVALETVLGAVSSLKILPIWLSARLTVHNTLRIVIELNGCDGSAAELLRHHAATKECVIDVSQVQLTHRSQVMV
jgi:hypothetical protein